MADSRTDLSRVDARRMQELERLVAEDEDERGIAADWTQAKLVLPQAKQSVHLRLEQEVIDFFKSHGQRAYLRGCKRFSRLTWTPTGHMPNKRRRKHLPGSEAEKPVAESAAPPAVSILTWVSGAGILKGK